MPVNNMYLAERALLETCKSRFKQRRELGNEYYECEHHEIEAVLDEIKISFRVDMSKVQPRSYAEDSTFTEVDDSSDDTYQMVANTSDDTSLYFDSDELEKQTNNAAFYSQHHLGTTMDQQDRHGTSVHGDIGIDEDTINHSCNGSGLVIGEEVIPTPGTIIPNQESAGMNPLSARRSGQIEETPSSEIEASHEHTMSHLEFYLGMNPVQRKYSIVYCPRKCVDLTSFKKFYGELMNIKTFALDTQLMQRLGLAVSTERMCKSCKSIWKGVQGRCSECRGEMDFNRGPTKQYIVGMIMTPCLIGTGDVVNA